MSEELDLGLGLEAGGRADTVSPACTRAAHGQCAGLRIHPSFAPCACGCHHGQDPA